jgi:hypothetical protein
MTGRSFHGGARDRSGTKNPTVFVLRSLGICPKLQPWKQRGFLVGADSPVSGAERSLRAAQRKEMRPDYPENYYRIGRSENRYSKTLHYRSGVLLFFIPCVIVRRWIGKWISTPNRDSLSPAGRLFFPAVIFRICLIRPPLGGFFLHRPLNAGRRS